MGFRIFTTTNPEHEKRIDAVIENINKSSLIKKSVNVSFENNELEFYFSSGFDNHTYYSLSYLMKEIAFHCGFVEGSDLKLIHNDDGLIIVTKHGEPFDISKSDESSIIQWVNKYLETTISLDNIEMDFVKPPSRTDCSFFSGKRRPKKTALRLFDPY